MTAKEQQKLVAAAMLADMTNFGTSPEIHCLRHACADCSFFDSVHAAAVNQPCPLQDSKFDSMKKGYDEILSECVGHPAKMITIPVWHDGYLADTKQIAADWRCPACGEIMGEPTLTQIVPDDGEPYFIDTWKNHCGHAVKYSELIIDGDGVGDDYETTRHLIKEVAASPDTADDEIEQIDRRIKEALNHE